jgi:hypothetical protein
MKSDVPPLVIDKLFDSGYEDQILDFIMACENKENLEVSDIPLSPTMMRDSRDKVIISPKVYETYIKFISIINNPQTAQEIPFILLGNRVEINGESYIVIEDIIYDMQEAKSEKRVTIDEETFRKMLTDSKYSVISIGHTHGNVNEEEKNNTLARTLPQDLRTKHDIRDTGLNISVADVWQHEAFIQIGKGLAPQKEIMQTVIMFNGDIVMINPNGITKSNNMQVILQDGRSISLPTGNNPELSHIQMR